MQPVGRCHSCPVHRHPVCQALASIEIVRSGRSSARRRYPKGSLLLDGNGNPEQFGVVMTGVVKLLHVAEDGCHEIVGLLFPGDYLAPAEPVIAHLTAEAATAVEVCCFPHRTFEALLKRNPQLERVMLSHTQRELDDVRAWMRVLTHRPALERVARFLVMVEQRTRRPDRDLPSDVLELPLSRAEMGDYLGMTIETLSRQLTRMRSAGIIETCGRYLVRVNDWKRLRSLATPAEATEKTAERHGVANGIGHAPIDAAQFNVSQEWGR